MTIVHSMLNIKFVTRTGIKRICKLTVEKVVTFVVSSTENGIYYRNDLERQRNVISQLIQGAVFTNAVSNVSVLIGPKTHRSSTLAFS